MKKIYLLIMVFFVFKNINAQCEFPRNTGTHQYQNAINYSGKIYQNNLPDGRMVFSIDPSKLALNKHEITRDSLLKSNTGEWFYKWNYAARPNRWQPMIFDCDATSVSIKAISGQPLTEGQIEVDFFYLDKPNKISATFKGTVVFDIRRGIFTGENRLSRVAKF